MLKKIAMICFERTIEQGTWIFHQDNPAKKLYLVLDGSVTLNMVSQRTTEDEFAVDMDTLFKGQIFGWSSLVYPHKYTMGARAGDNSRLVEIDGSELRKILDEHPAQGYHFMNNISELISERLRARYVEIFSLNATPIRA